MHKIDLLNSKKRTNVQPIFADEKVTGSMTINIPLDRATEAGELGLELAKARSYCFG